MEPLEQLKPQLPQSTGMRMRPLSNQDYTNSFVSGIFWGAIVLLLILFLSWLVSIMRYRRV